MRVLTVIEPWASLIAAGVKKIETRSWKTNYRGKLYIHASKKQITKNQEAILKDRLILLANKEFKYGYIIAVCNLEDCVYMDDEFIKQVKKNKNEYLCGEYKKGRYAWILSDIKVLKTPIKAQGMLGIWKYE